MKTPIILAHLIPRFHGGGAVFLLLLMLVFLAIALILTCAPQNKDK